jgi:glutamate synthase (NADPH/NADH) small chain
VKPGITIKFVVKIMGKPTGFKEFERSTIPYQDPLLRIVDFNEFSVEPAEEHLTTQGARCMDCGVPFCMSATGCPVDNLIPEWNDLVYRGRWREAIDRLHKTNNFPEFTGRVCPAPCEGACCLGVTDPPVTIKNIENTIVDRAFAEGWITANRPPSARENRSPSSVRVPLVWRRPINSTGRGTQSPSTSATTASVDC